MSRLTRRGSFQFDNSQIEEKGIYVKDGNSEEIFFAEYEEAYPAIEKLCNMEDIEDQISTILDDKVSLKDVVRHLVKALKNDEDEFEFARVLTNAEAETWDRWKALFDQGKLKEMPCAVGNTVWFLNGKYILPFEVTGFSVDDDGPWLIHGLHHSDEDGNDYVYNFKTSKIGKTVFLSEQEANAKLNELIGNSPFGKLSESENQKSCNTCTNKKTHDALTENGNVPMCCLHCKWAEDLYDDWQGQESLSRENKFPGYKGCNTCLRKETHDDFAKKNGSIPMCCIHCKWSEDLIDKWKGEKI